MKLKFFIWLIEFKLNRIPDKDKILYLANRLLDEAEGQGYNCNPTNADLFGLDINWFRDNKILSVGNSLNRWEVRGERSN